jgi:hypothetical protein
LPRRLLLHPPIARRGSTASARVTPFEFHLLVGVLVQAQAAASDAVHAKAFEAGARAIALEQHLATQFKQEWQEVKQRRRRGEPAEAPERYHTFAGIDGSTHSYKPLKPRAKAVRWAGHLKYQKAHRRARRNPDDVVLTITRYALLRSAGLANAGSNLRKLEAALDRLCRAVGDGIPPLLGWKQEGKRLCLQVAREWLQPPYARFPLPLPPSATALALALFAWGVTDGEPPNKRGSIGFAQLCDRLDVPRWGNRVLNRTVKRALDIVNDQLEALDPQRGALAKERVFPPESYEIEAVYGNKVRVLARSYQLDECELEEPEQDEQPTKQESVVPPARKRLKPETESAPAPVRQRLRPVSPESEARLLQERRRKDGEHLALLEADRNYAQWKRDSEEDFDDDD